MFYKFIIETNAAMNVSKEYIESLEAKWKIQFPEVLVDYYLHYNMSLTAECSFTLELAKGEDSEFILDCMIPLKYGTIPLEKEYEAVLDDEARSDDFIPLAYDMDGDLYYWHKKTYAVWYISHENVENPIFICDSVEKYFDLLNQSCDL